ncbi:2-C-methyl-D-erythritol 2,4-cyclodiphosphate synthase [Helicobacter didelphidarum]|uniref:Bifunctional enzyme IspD/IspF n=2 Tax=Helicobacter didelphidarum TaxID=2040648 RepID=A0A3D8IRZ0_9HELI|nr:2-C-methyl-D-erythritol 2,4-cyclodiphosphate synthase [Helicobacter didelphidarum]
MKSLTLIIMAAGDSLRFCNNFNDADLVLSNSFCKSYDYPIPHAMQKPHVKKQWIRINTTPLWLYVAQSLAQKTLECIASFPTQQNEHPFNPDFKSLNQTEHHSCFSLKKIIITASPKDISYMKKLSPESLDFLISNEDSCFNAETCNQICLEHIPLLIVTGGNTRFQSLKNALQEVDSDFVLVNDCARFNTKTKALYNMLQVLEHTNCDCVAPCLNVSDTVMLCQDIQSHNKDSDILQFKQPTHTHVPRELLRLIQTPQISRTSCLLESFHLNKDFTDETSAICALPNTHLELVQGDRDMAKLTYMNDIHLLDAIYKEIIESQNPYTLQLPRQNLLSSKVVSLNFTHKNILSTSNILIGQGSDIHAFEDSKEMWLCGVRIESPYGFKAHSDGDVGIHALIDSLLGAMNHGDIGEMFPDTDSQFKNMDSKILLQEVYDYCLSTGLEIGNIDITIIAQTPHITPYKQQMQECLANILYLNKSQISIKASTAEKLGFVGRKEGVFAQCVVLLRPREITRHLNMQHFNFLKKD